MTFRRTLTTVLVRNLVRAALVVLSATAMHAAIGDTVVSAPAAAAPESIKTVAALELLAEHDCWTTEAPADMVGVLPARVVVMVDGEARLGGERMVGKALDQLFGGIEHDLTVVGFCR